MNKSQLRLKVYICTERLGCQRKKKRGEGVKPGGSKWVAVKSVPKFSGSIWWVSLRHSKIQRQKKISIHGGNPNRCTGSNLAVLFRKYERESIITHGIAPIKYNRFFSFLLHTEQINVFFYLNNKWAFFYSWRHGKKRGHTRFWKNLALYMFN